MGITVLTNVQRKKKERIWDGGGREQEEGEGERGITALLPPSCKRERRGRRREGKTRTGSKKGEKERRREGEVDHHYDAKRLTAAATEAEVPTRQEDSIPCVCDTDDTLCSEVLLIITVLFLLTFVPLLLPLPIMVLGFVFNAIDLL